MNAPVISPAVSAGSAGTAGDTGWSATIDACHGLLAIALGTNNMDDTFERACREPDRKTAARSQDPRLTRLRRLLKDEVSLERAQHEIMGAGAAPETTVDALVYSLRRGIDELTNVDTLHRLSGLGEGQLKAVCRRVQSFNPEIATPWSSDEVAALIAKWRELHERR
jgi:hypothetical protein